MKIRKYNPFYGSYYDCEGEFSSKEDLLKINWIRYGADTEGFSGYMVSWKYLMSTFNYNTNKKPSWYPIGIFDDAETVNCVKKWFPHWGTPVYVMKNGDMVEVQSFKGRDIMIRITKSNNDSRLISDYREMTVTSKWFHENYSHNVFKMP